MPKGQKRVRRQREFVVNDSPPEGYVPGKTCITCWTRYSDESAIPPFQLDNVKHGCYDVERQLPHTSRQYPSCYRCLPYAWRAEADRFGMREEVQEAYAATFAA